MRMFVQDQKNFLLGQASLAQQSKNNEESFISVKKLTNFDVLPDGSIRPRKPFKKIFDDVPLTNSWVFNECVFYLKGKDLYVKRKNKEDIQIKHEPKSYYIYEQTHLKWRLNYRFDAIPFPIPESPMQFLYTIKKVKNIYFLLFENFPFYKVRFFDDDVHVVPFYMQHDSNNDASEIIRKYPFFKLNINPKMKCNVTEIDLGTNRCKVSFPESDVDILNQPIICNPRVANKINIGLMRNVAKSFREDVVTGTKLEFSNLSVLEEQKNLAETPATEAQEEQTRTLTETTTTLGQFKLQPFTFVSKFIDETFKRVSSGINIFGFTTRGLSSDNITKLKVLYKKLTNKDYSESKNEYDTFFQQYNHATSEFANIIRRYTRSIVRFSNLEYSIQASFVSKLNQNEVFPDMFLIQDISPYTIPAQVPVQLTLNNERILCQVYFVGNRIIDYNTINNANTYARDFFTVVLNVPKNKPDKTEYTLPDGDSVGCTVLYKNKNFNRVHHLSSETIKTDSNSATKYYFRFRNKTNSNQELIDSAELFKNLFSSGNPLEKDFWTVNFLGGGFQTQQIQSGTTSTITRTVLTPATVENIPSNLFALSEDEFIKTLFNLVHDSPNLYSLNNINGEKEPYNYTLRYPSTNEDEALKGDVKLKFSPFSSNINDPNKIYKTVIKTGWRYKLGLTLSSEYFHTLFQCLLDRFYFIYPLSKNSDGTFTAYIESFGEKKLENYDLNFSTTNWFISDFYDGWPIDVEEFGDKYFYSTKKCKFIFSEFGNETILSNPYKALINNRSIQGLTYNEQNYPGISKDFIKAPDLRYKEFIEDIQNKGISFTLLDALGFSLDDCELKTSTIHSLTAQGGKFIKVHVFTNNGVYLLAISGINSEIHKISNFILKDNIEPIEVDELLVFSDFENLFSVDLNSSNNVSFIFSHAALASFSGIGTEIKKIKSIDNKQFLVLTDKGCYRFLVVNKKIVGCSEYKTKSLITDIFNNGVVHSEKAYVLGDSYEEYDCLLTLFPFTISSFYPGHGYFYSRTLQYLYLMKDPKLTDIKIGCNNINTNIEKYNEKGKPIELDMQKIEQTEIYKDNDVFCLSLKQKNNNKRYKIYGISFVLQSQGDI